MQFFMKIPAMIKQKASVVRADDKTVWLNVERESVCSSCKVKQGCGTGMLAKHIGRRFSQVEVNKTGNIRLGQQVELAMPAHRLLQGAFLVYAMPLVFMFIFAILMRMVTVSNIAEVIAGIVGLLTGFFWAGLYLRHNKASFQAKIIEEKNEVL